MQVHPSWRYRILLAERSDKSLCCKASRWPVAPAGQPVSIAIDLVRRRLLIGGRNPKMLVVMDADSGKIIGQPFPIGDRVDANVY